MRLQKRAIRVHLLVVQFSSHRITSFRVFLWFSCTFWHEILCGSMHHNYTKHTYALADVIDAGKNISDANWGLY